MPLTSRDILFVLRAQDFVSRELRNIGSGFNKLQRQAMESQRQFARQSRDAREQFNATRREIQANTNELKALEKQAKGNLAAAIVPVEKRLRGVKQSAQIANQQFQQSVRPLREANAALTVRNKQLKESVALGQTSWKQVKAEVAENERVIAQKREQITQTTEQHKAAMRGLQATKMGLQDQQRVLRDVHTQEMNNIAQRKAANTRAIDAAKQGHAQLQQQLRADHEAQMARFDALQQRYDRMQSAGMAMAMGGGMLAAAGGIGVNFFKEATQGAMETHRAMSLAVTQAKDAGGTIEGLTGIARRVAAEVPQPYEQMGEGLYDIFSSIDVNMDQAERYLREFSKAAVAGQVDLQDASRTSIAIMNAFPNSGQSVNDILDIQFRMVEKGIGTYDEFSGALGRALPAANRAGQSFETLAGMMTFLTRNGLSTEMAATSAARGLETLAHPKTISRLRDMGVAVTDANGELLPMRDVVNGIAQKLGTGQAAMSQMFDVDPDEMASWVQNSAGALQSLGVEVKDSGGALKSVDEIMSSISDKVRGLPGPERAAALTELFKGAGGTIQARRFWDMAILNSTQFGQRLDEIADRKGAMARAYDIMFDSPSVQIQRWRNNLEILKEEIGDPFLAKINNVVDVLVGWIDAFRALDKGTRDMITQIGAFLSVAALISGVAMLITGAFLMMAGAVGAAQLSIMGMGAVGTTLAILAGIPLIIAAIVAAAWLLYDNWEAVKGFFIMIWEAIVGAVRTAWDYLKGLWEQMGERSAGPLRAAWERISSVARTVWEAITGYVRTAWSVMSSIFGAIVSFIIGVFKVAWETLSGIVRTVWNVISEYIRAAWNTVIKPIWDVIVAFVKTLLVPAFQFLAAMFKTVWDAIKSALSAAWNGFMKPIFDFIVRMLKEVVVPVLQFLGSVFKVVFEAIAAIVRVFWDIASAIFTALIQFIAAKLQPVIAAWRDFWIGVFEKVAEAVSGWWNNKVKPILDYLIGFWLENVSPVIGKVRDAWGSAMDAIGDKIISVWNGIKSGMTTIINGIIGVIEGMVNRVVDGVNSMISKLNALPGVSVNAVGGVSLSRLPTGAGAHTRAARQPIKALASGGTLLSAGAALVGEAGPELLTLPAGARVTPLSGRSRTAGTGTVVEEGAVQVIIQGNVTEDVMPEVQRSIDEAFYRLTLELRRG